MDIVWVECETKNLGSLPSFTFGRVLLDTTNQNAVESVAAIRLSLPISQYPHIWSFRPRFPLQTTKLITCSLHRISSDWRHAWRGKCTWDSTQESSSEARNSQR